MNNHLLDTNLRWLCTSNSKFRSKRRTRNFFSLGSGLHNLQTLYTTQNRERERERQRQTRRERDRERDRQTQRERETDRQTDRQGETDRDRKREREGQTEAEREKEWQRERTRERDAHKERDRCFVTVTVIIDSFKLGLLARRFLVWNVKSCKDKDTT